MLCPTCASIFQGDRPPLYDEAIKSDDVFESKDREREYIQPLHEDISGLCEGALNGCQICDITWRHFFRDKTPQEYASKSNFLRNGNVHMFYSSGLHYRMRRPDKSFNADYSPHALELEVGLNSPMDRDIPKFKSVMLTPVENEPAVSMTDLPAPNTSIYGKQTWATIQKWISDCKQNHQKCRAAFNKASWYPTRLLDLEYEYSSDPTEQLAILIQLMAGGHLPADIRLIETATSRLTGPYMTLSHRWQSTGKSIQTTKSNIAQRKHKILAQELPTTFEQAIQFTRRLGVRYLWIDSLCIIQGDDEDWAREAMVMGDVYSHSMLNISATVDGISLLHPRNRHIISPSLIQPTWTGVTGATGQKPMTYVVTDFRFWEDRIHKSPCNKRAWITQERWMSPRVIHFAFDQLVWECRELEAAESFPLGLTREARSNYTTGFKQETTEVARGEGVLSEQRLRHDDWSKILSTYGRSEVTFEKDRLVAVAGVAKRFSELLNDVWIAGLWKRTLPGDLLWCVRGGKRTNKPPVEMGIVERELVGTRPAHTVNWSERLRDGRYQAPSWSWASVLGDITPGLFIEQDSKDSMITVLEISLTPLVPRQPLGQLKAGNLKLHGILYPLAMDPPDWPGDQPTWRRTPPKIYLKGLAKKKSKPMWEGGPIYDIHSHSVHIQPDEPVDFAAIGRACFLPVVRSTYQNPGHAFHGSRMVKGLCLLPTGKRGEYQRIGRVDFGNEESKLFEDGLEVQSRSEEETGLKAHPPTLDEGLYEDGEVGVVSII